MRLIDRRRALAALPASLALAGAGAALAQSGQSGEAPPFDPQMVATMARDLARKPFVATQSALPDPFANLNYDAYVAIRSKPKSAVWSGENLPFVIEPLHRGYLFAAPMQIHLVENGRARRLVYDPAGFDLGKLNPPATLGDIGFSGVRILSARPGETPAETAIFQGASFFRAHAVGQNFGLLARALSLRTADARGEEFPAIKAIWIERPTPAATDLVIHALIDSESASGACRFTLRPGEATIIDTEARIFARAALDHIGVATMQGTYLMGPIDRRRSEDVRPGVYEVSGLQIQTGAGEWLWRPVSNREALQISVFADANPKGFGLIQRERNFSAFMDDDQHWEMRPSLWIEPIGDWGPGAVQLVEIPSEAETNDNVVAYWRPRQTLAAGAELAIAYRQFWCWSPPEAPPLATVVQSRGGRIGANTRRRRFIVEFAGEIFADAQRAADVRVHLTVGPGAVSPPRTFHSRDRKLLRVVFDLDPPTDNLSELRLLLESGGKPVSETWVYRWTT